MNILHSIGASIASIGLFIAGLFGYAPSEDLGVALPSGTAVFESSLATGIDSSATSMTLTSVSIRGGGTLSGYQCFTIDEGSAQAEYVCGNASGTSITGLERGISPSDGVTQDSDLKFSHRRGASVKITDFPLIQRIKSQNNGEGTFQNVLQYDSGVIPTGVNDIADVGYVLSAITGTSSISYDRQIVPGTAGETITRGQIVFYDATQDEWMRASASLASTSVKVQLGIAQGAGTNGNAISGGILRSGYDETQRGMTAGDIVYLSNTAGATSTTPGTFPIALGQARSATALYFDPLYSNIAFTSASNTFTGINTFASSTLFNATTTFNASVIGATRKIVASSSQQLYSIATSTGEVDLATMTVTGGTLGTTNAISYAVYLSGFQAAAGGHVVQLRLKYGGTTIATSTITHSGNAFNGWIEGIVAANNSTSSQFGVMTTRLMQNTGTAVIVGSDTNLHAYFQDTGTVSINSATDQTLSVTAQLTSGTNDTQITIAGYLFELSS